MIAANAPDIDMLSYVHGPFYALAFRRGVTHAWPALPVLAVAVWAVMLAWDRWIRRARDPGAEPARARPILALSCIGLLTHPTLDWMNTYGMRWALPFDGTWSYGDALFIIDPWIWLALGGAVFLMSDARGASLWGWLLLGILATTVVFLGMPVARIPWLVGVGLLLLLRRLSPSTGARRRLVRAALAAVSIYIGLLVSLDEVARGQVLQAAEERALSATDVMVSPIRANPFVSDVEVITDSDYVPGVHRWFGAPRVELDTARSVPRLSAPPALPRNEAEEVAARALEHPDVRHYLVWARYPYVRIASGPAGWTVAVRDARYDDVPEAGSLRGLTVHVPTPGTR